MLSTHLCLMPKLRLSGAIQLLHLHIWMEWTEQCSFTTCYWSIVGPQREMLFTSTVLQTYVKKSDWLYMKQWQIPVFSFNIFPLNYTFFCHISFFIYLYFISFAGFILCIFFVGVVLRNLLRLFTHKIYFTNNYVSVVEQFHSCYTITYST